MAHRGKLPRYIYRASCSHSLEDGGNFNPKPFGVILAKLEKHHTDSISTLVETVRFLLGELTTLKSQVAALDSVVDVVTPAPFSTVLSPAPRRVPAPPAAATKLPVPPPPPSSPPHHPHHLIPYTLQL